MHRFGRGRRIFLTGGAACSAVALMNACGVVMPSAPPTISPGQPEPGRETGGSGLAATVQPTVVATDGDNPGRPDKPASATTVVPPLIAGKAALTWALPAEVGPERDFWVRLASIFERQNPKIKVEMRFGRWVDYESRLQTLLNGDNVPDVIHLHASFVQDYGLHGLLLDLHDHLQATDVSKDGFFPFLMDLMLDFRTRSKLWAVPKDSAVLAIYYNKDLFDLAGVAYPKTDWTFSEFRETARRLTLDKNGNSAISSMFDRSNTASWGINWAKMATDLPLPGSDLWQMIALSQAGPWFSDDMRQVNLDQHDHIEFLRQIISMCCQDLSMVRIDDSLGQGDAWRNGLVAMKIADHSQILLHQREQRTFEYDVVPPPSGPKGQFTVANCSGWGIPSRAKYPDEAWSFIRFLVAEGQQTEMVKTKRWGAAIKASQRHFLPEDGTPANFRAAFYDPMFGLSTTQVKVNVYPPFLREIRQLLVAEYEDLFACSNISLAAVANRSQLRIQALLDQVWQT